MVKDRSSRSSAQRMRALFNRMGKRGLILLGVGILLGLLLVSKLRKNGEEELTCEVQRGRFEVKVEVSGELLSVESIPIRIPVAQMRSSNVRINNVTIKDLVPEGTVVDSGDYVGELDRESLTSSLKGLQESIEKAEQQFLKTQLDTALTLRDLRNGLQNMQYNLEERQLVLEQSKYEPPATVRQAELNLEKAKREYQQAKQNYQLKLRQAKATMHEASLMLMGERRKQDELMQLESAFTIKAPSHGMVVYFREWGGEKRKVGSSVSLWSPEIAELPDLTDMYSITYVNEVDVSKVKVGQEVRVGLDAFPDVSYKGSVQQVANIGEERSGSSAKVFEVQVGIEGEDSIMRPSMTTSNTIIVSAYDSVLYCPLECVQSNDSLSYVYLKEGYKQQVELGAANDTHVIVARGLKEGQRLYLSVPAKADKWKLKTLDVTQPKG